MIVSCIAVSVVVAPVAPLAITTVDDHNVKSVPLTAVPLVAHSVTVIGFAAVTPPLIATVIVAVHEASATVAVSTLNNTI